jgi:nitroreductase
MDPTRQVPADVLREILVDATWAPTHGMTQPWRFNVFTGPSRERLAGGLESLYDQLTSPADRRPDKRGKLRSNALGAPVAIAVSVRFNPESNISELDELAAVCCAVENLLLSAHQRGLGTFWSSSPVTCDAGFAAWLGQGDDHRPMGMVFMGYPRVGVNPTSIRLPLEDRVVFHEA